MNQPVTKKQPRVRTQMRAGEKGKCLSLEQGGWFCEDYSGKNQQTCNDDKCFYNFLRKYLTGKK